jgi:3D (Asp-Asp-Asp) domain-containing protein
VQGTIQVIDRDGGSKTFNYLDHSGPQQTVCEKVLNRSNEWLSATGRTRFREANGQFGDGVKGYALIPYRTIATDLGTLSPGSVVYIPEARGQIVELPSGKKAARDGYFFAADTGGAIKRPRVDIFAGVSTNNPFPGLIQNRESGTFEAYVITNTEIHERLDKAHRSGLKTPSAANEQHPARKN